MGRTRNRKPKTGDYRKGKTERWNGSKWVPVRVVHRGQRATLGGRPVTADGRGNWVTKGNSRGNGGTVKGRYAPGERVTTTPLKPIPASKRPKDMQAGKVYGDAGQPPAPTLPPKTTPTRSTPTRSTRTKTTPTKPTPKTTSPKKTSAPQSKDMDANYKAWAKANPTLAKKVKKGQAGYKAVKSSSPKAASAADAQNLRSGPTPPKRTSLKTTATKPTKPTKPATKPTKQKPLTVPTNRIPKNLNSPAGRKYLADLDAGKLTRRRK